MLHCNNYALLVKEKNIKFVTSCLYYIITFVVFIMTKSKKREVLNISVSAGFTLIELLTVMVIIGVLSATILVKYHDMVAK